MPSPILAHAVALLTAQGINVRYAFPPEGMRGWCGTQAIPTHVTGDKLDAVYNYLNWTNEGFLGALIMRQGRLTAQRAVADLQAQVHLAADRLAGLRAACQPAQVRTGPSLPGHWMWAARTPT